MPAARSARKATKKAPCATGHHSPDVEVDEGPSPVVDGMKATGRQGKAGQAPKVGRTRAQVTATPTRSLPSRRGRNVHPAGQPRIRRSKAQIEADLAAGEKALKEKAREVQAAKEHLAQLNIMEECEEDDLPVSHPQLLSTVIHKRRHADVETDSDESFDLSEADDGSHSDASDNSSSKSNKATETRTKSQRAKRVKGATRQELLARTEELRSAKHNVKKSQQQQKSKDDIGSFTAQELRCKKYANSGLRPQAVAPPNVAQLQQLEADPFELGGICDSDLEDTRLAIAEVDGPTTNPSRRNELVKFREKSEGVHPDKPQAARKLPKSKAAKAIIKAIPYEAQEPVTEAHPNVAHQCLNDPGRTVQVVFELAFTNISYELSLQDSIVKAAYNRMKTRRSKIASDVLTLVKTFFERVEFKNQPEKVKEYVHWALRAGGPAYYDVPVPKSCMLQKDDPDYPFILPIAETYMGFSAKSVLSPSLGPRNPPKGLYAIILTAVERAMRAHLTGAFRAPSDFNHRTTWNSMKDFYRILDQISESRWMQALNFTDCDDIENPMDESLLSAYRIDIYIPSSPTKPGA
ncbi:hypothetical protein EDB85DRAFT_2182811 [Lactarius pseudohatsudake]|nr:hypothetical protein EDB85DRAFT_2182811 [Lactarius pseudohatsudake]